METKANSKGQITIPAEICRQLGIKDGTPIRMDVDADGRILLTPITRAYVHSLRGRYKGNGLLKGLVANKRLEF